MNGRPPKGRRGWLIGFIILAGLLFVSARSIAVFYTDLLWYREVGYQTVFWRRIGAELLLGLGMATLVFAFVFVNLLLVNRARGAYRDLPRRRTGPEEEILFRYKEYAAPYLKWIRLAVAGFFALSLGFSARSAYEEFLLWANSVPFGRADPVFGVDISFYVFRLGFLNFMSGQLFTLVLVTIVVVGVAHFFEGGIRIDAPQGQRIAVAVKVHLSVLFALLALVRAAGYWLDRYALVFSDRGVVTGASATDVKATLPALNLLIVISILVALLLVANIWRKGWALPLVALGLWLLVQVIGVGVFPALYQRFGVQPQEFAREREYIERNIAGTRAAYDLENVEVAPYSPKGSITYEEAVQDEIGRATRLWDPLTTNDTFNQTQALRGYYQFPETDIDRYKIGDRRVQTTVSVRELDRTRLPSRTWVNEHLQFTHGYGMVVSPANSASADGRPEFFVRDMPPYTPPEVLEEAPHLRLDKPQVYFGQVPSAADRQSGFAIVRTKEREFDFPRGSEEEATTVYDGTGGVQLDSVVKKAAFALRFNDLNPLISSQITDESRMIFRIDIRDRVADAMPFLYRDGDPYPVIHEGRIVWIQDAYTISGRYPYSQKFDSQRVDRGAERVTDKLKRFSDLKAAPNANYIRNSVKAVIDAYEGSVKLYVVDPDDPIIQAYQKMFPGIFTDQSEVPQNIREHFRYAEDYFVVQSNMFRVYHVTDPRVFYNQDDKWQIPERTQRGGALAGQKTPLEPYYTTLRIPGEEEDSFIIQQPFTPQGRPNLLGFMIGNSDPDRFGQLTAFAFPRDRLVDGPEQVTARIHQEPAIAQELTLLDQRGSRVNFGTLLTLPVAGDLIYVQPVFVDSEDVRFPTLQRVIVSYKTRVVMRDCTAAALFDVLSDPPPRNPTGCPQGAATPLTAFGDQEAPPPQQPQPTLSPGQPPPGSGESPGGPGAEAALANAARAYDEAQAALRNGNLAEYQRKVDEMKRWIDEAQRSGA